MATSFPDIEIPNMASECRFGGLFVFASLFMVNSLRCLIEGYKLGFSGPWVVATLDNTSGRLSCSSLDHVVPSVLVVLIQTRREMAEHNLNSLLSPCNHVFSPTVLYHDGPFLSPFTDKGLHIGPTEIQGSFARDFSGANPYRPGRAIGGFKCSWTSVILLGTEAVVENYVLCSWALWQSL